jgi:hypothetical protein
MGKNELTVKKDYLPDSIDQLQEYILIGKERLKAYHLKVSAIYRLELAREVREQAVEDGQRMGEALLWAEAKLGELLKEIEPKRDKQSSTQRTSLSSLPNGITHKQSHFAQTLADHKDVIEEVIQEAKDNEDIPTRTQVLQKIEIKKRKHDKPLAPKPEKMSDEFNEGYIYFKEIIKTEINNRFKETSKQAILDCLTILTNITKGARND